MLFLARARSTGRADATNDTRRGRLTSCVRLVQLVGWNMRCCVHSSNSRRPRLKMSLCTEYGRLAITSGAMYTGVPANVWVSFCTDARCLATPKSPSLKSNRYDTNTFASCGVCTSHAHFRSVR